MSLPHLVASRLRQSGQKTYLAILLWSLQQWTNFESISYYFSLIDPLPKIWNQFFYSSKSLCGKKIAICKQDFFAIGYEKTFAIWIPSCNVYILTFVKGQFFHFCKWQSFAISTFTRLENWALNFEARKQSLPMDSLEKPKKYW